MSNGSNPFEAAAKGFGKLVEGWTGGAAQRAVADGLGEAGDVIKGIGAEIGKLGESVWNGLETVLANLDPAGKAEAVAAFVAAGIESMIGTANKLLEALMGGAAAAGVNALGALLGLIEGIKKAIHLVLDQIGNPKLTAPVTIPLDLINNLLGNVAEIVSPEAGAKARRFRSDMYGQLYEVRRAKSALVPVPVLREEPGEKR
jgi:hypothetical protein